MGISSLFNSLKLCLFSAQDIIYLLQSCLKCKVSSAFHLSISVIPFPANCTDIVRHLFAPPPLFSLPFLSPFTLFISRAPTTTGQYEKTQPKIHGFFYHIPLTSAQSDTNTPPHPLFLPALTTTKQPAMSSHSFSFRFAILSAVSERCGVTWLRATPMQLPILYSMSSWGEVTEALQGLQK